ncbi:hypothetical protein EPN96_09105 [bacterium]|nr:MAG: hypothetical protein EPN96_09105 [bacterium]
MKKHLLIFAALAVCSPAGAAFAEIPPTPPQSPSQAESPFAPSSQNELRELSAQLEAVKKKYEDLKLRSENVTATIEERDRLSQENAEITEEAEELRSRLKVSDNSSLFKWFLAGALVFLAGWLLGAAGGRNKRGNPYY